MVDFNVGMFFVYLGWSAVQTWNPINRRLSLAKRTPRHGGGLDPVDCPAPGDGPGALLSGPPQHLELLGWMAAIGLLEMLNQRVLARAYVQGETVVVLALHYTRLPLAAIVGLPDVWRGRRDPGSGSAGPSSPAPRSTSRITNGWQSGQKQPPDTPPGLWETWTPDRCPG